MTSKNLSVLLASLGKSSNEIRCEHLEQVITLPSLQFYEINLLPMTKLALPNQKITTQMR